MYQKFRHIFSFNKFIKSSPKFSDNSFSKQLIQIIGYKPYETNIFIKAFTHSSNLKEKKSINHFERLEFLGDAVLGSLISDYLFNEYPEENEGFLTQNRSKLVQRKTLNDIGEKLKLTELLIINNEKVNLGAHINGNLYEALIGAIYIDGGINKAKTFIENTLFKHLKMDEVQNQISSYKSFLYEWTQKVKKELSFNTFEEENAEDITIFVSVVRLNQKVIAKGRGTSKKIAEENASKRAYYSLKRKINS